MSDCHCCHCNIAVGLLLQHCVDGMRMMSIGLLSDMSCCIMISIGPFWIPSHPKCLSDAFWPQQLLLRLQNVNSMSISCQRSLRFLLGRPRDNNFFYCHFVLSPRLLFHCDNFLTPLWCMRFCQLSLWTVCTTRNFISLINTLNFFQSFAQFCCTECGFMFSTKWQW